MARVFTDGGAMKLASANTKLFGADVFSCAFWIYRTAAPAAERGLMGAGDFASDFGWWLNLTATGLIKAIAPYATVAKARSSSTATTLNGWTHVVVNYQLTGLNSTDFTFFINGKSEAGTSVSNGSGAAPANSATPFFVGPSPGTDTTALTTAPPANIGPIAVWSRVLSAAEALALATGEHPLRFKEGLVEIFDLAAAAGEEGWLAKVYLVQGATNPTSAAVSPPLLPPPGSQPGETHLNVRPTVRSRARYNVVAAAAQTIFGRPIMPSSASLFGRQLAASVFAIHSVIGHSVPQRLQSATTPAVATTRVSLPRVRSIVGTPRFANPSPVNARWTHAVVSSAKTPPPKIRSFVGTPRLVGPSPGNTLCRKPVLAETRTPRLQVRSTVGSSRIAPPAQSAQSRARPLTALVRSLRPSTRAIVGSPLPRVTVTTPAPSRARPVVTASRTPPPKVSSFEGPQGRWFLASHERWSKPIMALVRSLRPVVRSTIGLSRPKVLPPAAPRPRPRVVTVRIPLPRILSDAGSGIARGPSFQLQLAIAVSTGTIALSIETTTVDALGPTQSIATVSLSAQQADSISLSPQNNGTISLTTTE